MELKQKRFIEKILVTGSAGFIGRHVIEELLRAGFKVELFDKKIGDNLLSKQSIQKKIKNCRKVIHLAACLSEDKKLLEKVNVKGTELLLEESAKNKIERFLFVSTAGVYNLKKGETATEKTKPQPVTLYEKSKLKAEKKVKEFQELVPYTIVRPAFVMGSNSYWKKILEIMKKGFLPGKGDNKWQTVYVKDLAQAIVFLTKNKEAAYNTYLVAGKEKPTLKELFELCRKQMGLTKKTKSIPVIPLMLFAYINTFTAKIFGKTPFISPAHIKRALKERSYCTDKLLKTGFEPKTGLDTAIKKTIQGLSEKK